MVWPIIGANVMSEKMSSQFLTGFLGPMFRGGKELDCHFRAARPAVAPKMTGDMEKPKL
jgi:hypothetical protein